MVVANYYNKEIPRENSSSDFPYVRAIITSGAAPLSDFVELRQAIQEVLPGLRDKIYNSIDPWFVSAIGAAWRARHIAQNPQTFKDKVNFCPGHTGINLKGRPVSHDEL